VHYLIENTLVRCQAPRTTFARLIYRSVNMTVLFLIVLLVVGFVAALNLKTARRR
jgi:hypothetical protein